MVVYRAGAATTSSQASLVRFRASIQFAPCSRIICRNPMLLCTCAPSSQHGSTRMATDHFSTTLSHSKGEKGSRNHTYRGFTVKGVGTGSPLPLFDFTNGKMTHNQVIRGHKKFGSKWTNRLKTMT